MRQPDPRRKRGFERTGGLIERQVRKASEKRGFAVAKLLTRWAEIVGPDTAAQARPVKVSYGRDGMGATLTLLCKGAVAPMVQANLPRIREKVNACYGYSAISRIRITQTAATGFAEESADFSHSSQQPVRDTAPAARKAASGVEDDGLRLALERLGTHVLNKSDREG